MNYKLRILFFDVLFMINFIQGIEQLKKEEASWEKKSRWRSVQAVFGRFSLSWLSPFTAPPRQGHSMSYMYAV